MFICIWSDTLGNGKNILGKLIACVYYVSQNLFCILSHTALPPPHVCTWTHTLTHALAHTHLHTHTLTLTQLSLLWIFFSKLFFRIVLGSEQNWMRSAELYSSPARPSSLPHCKLRRPQRGIVIIHDSTGASLSPKVHTFHVTVYSQCFNCVGFDTCIATYIYHYSIMQNSLTLCSTLPVQPLWFLSIHPLFFLFSSSSLCISVF